MTYVGSSVVEDRQVELAKARGVGDHVDLDDLPVREREPEDPKQPSSWSHDGSDRPVHERRSCESGTPREGERLLGPDPRTTDLSRCTRTHGSVVGSDHDVRVEQREQRVEVTRARPRGTRRPLLAGR